MSLDDNHTWAGIECGLEGDNSDHMVMQYLDRVSDPGSRGKIPIEGTTYTGSVTFTEQEVIMLCKALVSRSDKSEDYKALCFHMLDSLDATPATKAKAKKAR